MEVIINDQKKQVANEISLALIAQNEIGEKINGIAIAVNNSVIPKQEWSSFQPKENDTILIIKATQGG